jgi:universal stress protein E
MGRSRSFNVDRRDQKPELKQNTMTAIRRILVAVKELHAKSHPAALKAAQLARACHAELYLFHCEAAPLYADLGAQSDQSLGLQRDLRRQALQRLEVLADQLRLHSIKVTVAAEWDYPVYEAIVRRALFIKADLIVVSRYAGRHTAPWMLRMTDWELVRLSPIPLLLVKNPHAYRHPAILAAVDPTHAYEKPLQLDKEILRMSRAVTEGLRGTLHAVHAYARMPCTTAVMTPPLFRKLERQQLRAAKARLTHALRSTRILRSRQYLIASDPVSAITQAARKSRSAIVVMGAVSRSGLKKLFIGNTAENILDELSCDILVVKPLKFRNRVPSRARGPRILLSSQPGIMGYM